MSSYILSLLVFSPLLGIAGLLFVSKNNEKALKRLGILGTILPLILTIYLYSEYLSGTKFTVFSVFHKWFQLGGGGVRQSQLYAIPFELSLNGISLVMVILTAILTTLAALASVLQIKKEWKGYFILLFLLEVGMLGVFLSQNLILFFLFFEVTLVAMFFLIGKWGYFDKEKAAFSFLIYNGLGSCILLFVIMVLFARTGTANIEILEQILSVGGQTLLAPISTELKYVLFAGIIIAFGIKLPIFPFHSWMLRVHVQAPPAIVILHAGVLLKIGAYGLIRFGMGFFPGEFKEMAFWIALLGVINFLYGAWLALQQTDFKLVLAYSSISHMGIVLMGLGALNTAGIQGALFQVVSHGLIAALLFLLVGFLYERVGTTNLKELGGLAKSIPVFSGILLAGGMASLGLPGMSGFISEFMAFMGLFKTEPILAAVGTLGIVLTAVYVLRAVLNMTFGAPRNELSIADLKPNEAVLAFVLLGFIILIGVCPAILEGPLQAEIADMMTGIGGD